MSESRVHFVPLFSRKAALIVLIASITIGVPKTAIEAFAQEQASPPQNPAVAVDQAPPSEQPSAGLVEIEGRLILTVYEGIGGLTPETRADHIRARIISVAKGSIAPESIHIQPRENWTEILAENWMIMAVTENDAKTAGKPRSQLSSEYAGNIRQAVINYRREHSWSSILRAMLYTLVSTGILVPVLFVLRKLRTFLRTQLERWISTRTQEHNKSAVHVAITYLGSLSLAIGAVVRWLCIFALIEIYLTVVFGFFSTTRSISMALTQWLFSSLGSLGRAAMDYVPNLLVISAIALIAVQIVRLVNLVFDEIARGHLQIGGFYPDWAEPTAKLVRMMVFILVVIITFPYLPGAKSPAFQGISIFVGVLLSLGSSSAVANAIAGIILTYMRSFIVGDWVKIGETTGEVVEKNLLVTRVLTPKKEIITLPNASVMSGSVTNFTSEAKKAGVIFHTTVTIGYDAPWRTVHELLIEAAKHTKNVLSEPAPFVLQTALNDFYVAYELNAFTDTPLQMQFIYSELHQNIQDRFNDAGVEICSPHFASLRDGNTIAIPEQYIARDYESPAFRVETSRVQQAQSAGRD